MSRSIEEYDHLSHFWCPMLGQPLSFAYCRRAREGLPCQRVEVCYQGRFAVAEFLETHFSPEQREAFLSPAPSRLERLANALAQAGQASAPAKEED